LSVSRTVVEEVLRKGVSALSLDASADERFKAGQSIIMQQIRSVMCVPLAAKETRLGVLYVDTTDARRKFGDRDLELLAAIGAQAGMTIDRARLIESLESLFIGAIRALVASVEARDRYTRGHSERVTAYSLAITDVLGLPDHDREIVELSGLLHDVGKIGVPEAILNKPAKLTDEEFAIIKLHPGQGAEIVKNIRHRFIAEVSLAVRHHHERWDGKGYPDGLPSEKSCRTSRILAVADTYDAMTSDRPYRKGFPAEKAVAVLREAAGTQLDPEFVGAFLEAHSSGAIAAAAGDGKPAVKSKYSAQASIDTGKFPPVRGRSGT
jgi:putative nucleotidyltransferase with HDIG domain